MAAKLGVIRGYDGAITTWADLSDITLRDASEELLGIDELRCDSMTMKSGSYDIGDVMIRHPRGRALREPDGAVVGAGVRLRSSSSTNSTTPPTPAPDIRLAAPLAGPL